MMYIILFFILIMANALSDDRNKCCNDSEPDNTLFMMEMKRSMYERNKPFRHGCRAVAIFAAFVLIIYAITYRI